MSKPISAFLGYYKVTEDGVINIFARSAIEVPPAKVSKGSPTPVQAAALAADISGMVQSNELIPINGLNAVVNPDVEANIAALLTTSINNSTITRKANSVKFGLLVPEAGPNKGVGVISITSKIAGVKSIMEIPIQVISE